MIDNTALHNLVSQHAWTLVCSDEVAKARTVTVTTNPAHARSHIASHLHDPCDTCAACTARYSLVTWIGCARVNGRAHCCVQMTHSV